MRSFAVPKALCHPNLLSKTVEDGSCSVKSRSEPLRWSLTGRLMVTLGIGGILSRRDVAQPGRALAWGARGRQFKSARPDQSFGDAPAAVPAQRRAHDFKAGARLG